MSLTGRVLGLADGDDGAGERHAAGVLQGDVDTVGAGFQKPPPQIHLAVRRWWYIIAHDVTHLSAAGIGHNGAGRGGDAEDKRLKDEVA